MANLPRTLQPWLQQTGWIRYGHIWNEWEKCHVQIQNSNESVQLIPDEPRRTQTKIMQDKLGCWKTFFFFLLNPSSLHPCSSRQSSGNSQEYFLFNTQFKLGDLTPQEGSFTGSVMQLSISSPPVPPTNTFTTKICQHITSVQKPVQGNSNRTVYCALVG